MSGSSTGPLVESEMVDARRFMWYPAYGSGPNDDTLNRFFPEYYALEYRLSNLLDGELAVVRAKLAELNMLDTAIAGASQLLNTDEAAVFKRNPNEVRDRDDLFRRRRLELCQFLGLPPGPGFKANGLRFVV